MICPSCLQEYEKLTKDHRVPSWLHNPSSLIVNYKLIKK